MTEPPPDNCRPSRTARRPHPAPLDDGMTAADYRSPAATDAARHPRSRDIPRNRRTVVSPALITDEAARPSGRPRAWSERLLAVPAAVLLGAALVDPRLGQFCLVPFGLLLASAAAVDAGVRRRSPHRSQLRLAAAMVTAFGWFWRGASLWRGRRPRCWRGVIALPLALHEPARDRRVSHLRGHQAQPHPQQLGAGDLRRRLPRREG